MCHCIETYGDAAQYERWGGRRFDSTCSRGHQVKAKQSQGMSSDAGGDKYGYYPAEHAVSDPHILAPALLDQPSKYINI